MDIDFDKVKVLYNHAKENRVACANDNNETGEFFWSGTINGIYSIYEILGIDCDWVSGRKVDFNEYYDNKTK